jgi:RNA polymerase sigma factor (sigma-70 family)
MTATPFNPFDDDSVRRWLSRDDDGGSERMERLLRNLPRAMKELTPREQQFLRQRFFQGMRVTDIAAEAGVQKSTVSRTLSRAQDKLFRALRYSL